MAAPAGLTEGSVPEPTEPEPPEPEPPEPELTEPELTEPELTEPEPPEPELTEPELTEPELTEPELTEPELTEPEPPEPDPTLEAAEAAEAGDTADTVDENALAVEDPEPDPEPASEQPASGTGQARGTSRLAVAAVIFGLIVLAGAAVGALAVTTHGFRPKSVVQYHLAAVFSLRPGDCLNSSPNGLSVTVLSCSTPHDGEVFAAFSLTAPSWPGDAAVQSEANNGCLSRIAGYVGPEFANAGLAQEYFYPDQAAWQAGVRTVVCEVRAPAGQLTGSVRDLG